MLPIQGSMRRLALLTGQSLPIFIQLVWSFLISARILMRRMESLRRRIARITVRERAAEHLHDVLSGD